MRLRVFNDMRCLDHPGGFGSMMRLTQRFLDVDSVTASDADVALFWNDALTTAEQIRAFPRRKVLYLSSNFTPAFVGQPGSYFDRFNRTTADLVAEADAISHTSFAHRQFFLQYICPSAAGKPSHVFPPMYDPAVFHPAPTPIGGLRVVAVALWRDWHRWITVFNAFAIVLRKVPSARLIIGGGYMGADANRRFPGNVHEAQRAVAEELHIYDAIDWRPTGGQGGGRAQEEANLAETYRQGNVFVHAYFADWGTFTCIEALASGLPVVCGDNGGLPEFAGDCARIFKYGAGYDSPTMPIPNPNEVAEKILQAYAGGEALRDRCIARAKQFEAENVCRGLQQFLEGIARG